MVGSSSWSKRREGARCTHADVSKRNFVKDRLPKIAALLTREEHGLNVATNLTLIIPEEAPQLSSPQRIVSAIEGITLLYKGMCKLHNEPENTLVLAMRFWK
jgi:hypothetical protein